MGTTNPITPTEVTVGEETVSLKRAGQSTVVMANILGRSVDQDTGVQTLWLDRIVHTATEQFYGWHVSGAISTVLRQKQVQGSNA
jgi:hypothetical protein